MCPFIRLTNLCYILILSVYFSCPQISGRKSSDDLIIPGRSYSLPGKYYIGGLFNVHNAQDGKCRQTNHRGLQRMYAMVYAIEKINERQNILPNISIGFDIYDTCADPNIAVAASIDFITSSSVTDCNGEEDAFRDFVGVVGPRTSSSAVSVASLFGLFKIPEVSFAATSTILSENRFEYFTRTVPTDHNQAIALADIASYFGWGVVAAISTDDLAYGIDGRDLFVEAATKRNVCVAYTQQINAESSVEHLESILTDLRALPNIKVIVAFATEKPILRLLNVFASHNATGYTWLGTDGWTLSVDLKNSSLTSVTKGMLGTRVHTQHVDGFDDFLRTRSPLTTKFQDPFIINYWEQTLACYLTEQGKTEKGYTDKCIGNESLARDDLLYDSPLVSSVLDAVDVVARALHEVLVCNSTEGCMDYQTAIPGDLMLECMKNVNFTGYSEYLIDFANNGDLLSEAWYDVINLQPSFNCSEEFDFEIVGHWRRSKGGLGPVKSVFWTHQGACHKESTLKDISPPKSFCSRSCHPGERRTSHGLSLCCWDCVACPDDHYSDTQDALSCMKCSEEQVANIDRTDCVDMQKIYINFKNSMNLIILCIAPVGVLLSTAIIAVFAIKKTTTVVFYACAETHAYTILLSIIFCFCFSGLSLTPANDIICILTSVIQLLPVTVVQGFLIVTAYISCKKNSKISLSKQCLILLLVVVLHMTLAVAWYFTSGPQMTYIVDKNAEIIYVDCGSNTSLDTKTILFIFNIALDCVGLAVSYQIKLLTDNFHEGKFVFFTFVIHVMLWVATLGTYLAITPGKHYQPLIVSFGMLLTGFAILGSIYVPKVYILKTKAEANDTVQVQKSNDMEDKDTYVKDRHTALKAIHYDPAAKQVLLENYRKAIGAAKGEKLQAIRVATMCNEKMVDLQLRYRKTIDEKKDALRRIRQRKVMAVVASPLVESVYC